MKAAEDEGLSSSELRVPPLVLFGRGERRQAGKVAASLGSKALVVAGGSAERNGLLKELLESIRTAGVDGRAYRAVSGEPTTEGVEDLRRALQEMGADVAVALGGGSVIDAAKAACGLVNETHPVREYQWERRITARCLPLVALPSTSGTGAEATPNAVIMDPSGPFKRSIRHDDMLPKAAIVDPEATHSCPRQVRAWAGLDALVQAIESHTSRHAGVLTRALSGQAIRLIGPVLSSAVAEPLRPEAPDALAAGSLLAGMALANARLGAVHGLAHPIGAHFGLPHGLICGVLFPHVARLNAEVVGDVYENEVTPYIRFCGADEADTLATRFERLLASIGIQPLLRVKKRPNWRLLAAEAMDSGSFRANPRELSEDEVIPVLKKVLVEV